MELAKELHPAHGFRIISFFESSESTLGARRDVKYPSSLGNQHIHEQGLSSLQDGPDARLGGGGIASAPVRDTHWQYYLARVLLMHGAHSQRADGSTNMEPPALAGTSGP